MIATPTMPSLAALLNDLAIREAQKARQRLLRGTTRSAAVALLATQQSQERMAREQQLAIIAARLAAAAARCEQCMGIWARTYDLRANRLAAARCSGPEARTHGRASAK